jgi:hypothetical protein
LEVIFVYVDEPDQRFPESVKKREANHLKLKNHEKFYA